MDFSVESVLTDTGITWNEFCLDPYPVFDLLKHHRVVYSSSKGGYFVFDADIVSTILFQEVPNEKKISRDIRPGTEKFEFFSKWLFYRSGAEHKIYKSQLFKYLQSNNIPFQETIEIVNVDDMFTHVKFLYYHYLVRMFFYLEDDILDISYSAASRLLESIQGHRSINNINVDDDINIINSLFGRPKIFEFSREFFDSCIINTIIDGFEPLSDLTWNTVSVMFGVTAVEPQIAYRIALSMTPSFRYIVRHLNQPIGTIPAGYPVYCVLGASALLYSGNNPALVGYPFGGGEHKCPGRGIVDQIVPGTAMAIHNHLRAQGVNGVMLKRNNGLGAEGIYEVAFR